MSRDVERRTADSGARLDRLPLGRWHYRLLGLITAGLFVDTFELYSGGAVLAALVQSGWSTVQVNATFLSVTFVGLTIGAWAAGVIGDRYGRRFCYQLNLALFGVASIAGAFAPDMTTLIVLRFFMGLGLGAEVVVGYAAMAEFVPARYRGRLIAVTVLLANSSSLVALLASSVIVPTLGWRWMFLLPGVAALAIWLLRRALPESPRWLESVGRVEEANALLRDVELAVAGRRDLPDYVRGEPAPTIERTPFSALFRGQVAIRTFIGTVLTTTTGFTLYGFLQWLPTFYVQQGLTFQSSLQLPTLMSAGFIVGIALAIWSADRLGRRRSIAVTSLCAALLCAGFVLSSGAGLVVAAMLLAAALGATSTVASNIYLPELFDTRVRLRGVGLCGAVGRLATAAVQFLVVALFAWGGVPAITATLAGILGLQAIIVLILGPETRRTSLEAASQAVPESESVMPSLAGVAGARRQAMPERG